MSFTSRNFVPTDLDRWYNLWNNVFWWPIYLSIRTRKTLLLSRQGLLLPTSFALAHYCLCWRPYVNLKFCKFSWYGLFWVAVSLAIKPRFKKKILKKNGNGQVLCTNNFDRRYPNALRTKGYKYSKICSIIWS